MKSRRLGLLATVLGGTAFLMVTAPFGLVFVFAASIVLTLLRISLPPERDFGAVGATRYRYEIVSACVGAVALPILVFVAAERDPWAFGSVPVGAIAGWIAATVQKRYLQSELRVSTPLPVPEDQ